MPATLLDLYNSALTKIGVRPMSSVDEDTREGIACRRYYEETRDEVLQQGDWTCATKVATLAQITGTVESSYDYHYQLPMDLLRIITLVDKNYADQKTEPYEKRGNTIFTDLEPCRVKYVGQVDAVADMDPHIQQPIIYALAMKVAEELVQKAELAPLMMQKYVAALQNAELVEADMVRYDQEGSTWWDEVT